MSSIRNPADGFEERLLTELREVVVQRAMQRPAAATDRGRRPIFPGYSEAQREWPARVGRVVAPRRSASALALAAAFAVLVLGVTSGSAPNQALAAFPVFATPATDAQILAPFLRHANANLADARAISTPFGKGYVIPAHDNTQLCIAVPDATGRAYGGACEDTSTALQQGLFTTFENSGVAEYVAVLPAGASNPLVQDTNGTTAHPITDGVAVIVVNTKSTITTRVGDSTTTTVVAPLGQCVPTIDACSATN
jgi:hypothetical protein